MSTKHRPHASRRNHPRQRRNGPVCWCVTLFAASTFHYVAAGLHSVFFVTGDLDLWPLTLTFKLVRARDQTRLPCEFGANPFSGSRDIRGTKKKKQKSYRAKNRTLLV